MFSVKMSEDLFFGIPAELTLEQKIIPDAALRITSVI